MYNAPILINNQTVKQKEHIIGIDLGTCCCCTSIYTNGRVEIIPNSLGNRTTPSYISFTETEILIGESAKNNCSVNAKAVIFDVKRLIGRLFTDKSVQSDLRYFPFNVIADETTGRPLISVDGSAKKYYPEQLSAMLLKQFKLDAQAYLNAPITKAVITVPAYFNNEQRQATKDAGTIAGLDVVRIINEPTAAALAYGINLCDVEKSKDKNILVFDFGGGTLDVSILNISNGCFEVMATSGDCHLGGEDCDSKLVGYCASEFAKLNKLTKTDVELLLKNTRAFRRLRSVCEDAKKALSTAISTNVQVDAFYNTLDLNVKISRAKFNEICCDIFNRCIVPLDNAIKDADIAKDKIDEVILIGGSTRIPYVRDMLKQYFDGKQLRLDVNPDEAVSIGASIQGAILSGKSDKNINDVILVDVIPLSLGIETSHGVMSKIITRNTPIPCSFQQLYSTEADNQRTVKINIFEGERALTKDNSLLGTFELAELPPMPRGTLRIIVIFDIDQNGILHVTASEESSGITKEIIVRNDSKKLSSADIDRLIHDAEQHMDIDNKLKITTDAKHGLENYLYSIKHALEISVKTTQLEPTDNSYAIQSILADAYKWIDAHSVQLLDHEIYVSKKQELENILAPLMKVYVTHDSNATLSAV